MRPLLDPVPSPASLPASLALLQVCRNHTLASSAHSSFSHTWAFPEVTFPPQEWLPEPLSTLVPTPSRQGVMPSPASSTHRCQTSLLGTHRSTFWRDPPPSRAWKRDVAALRPRSSNTKPTHKGDLISSQRSPLPCPPHSLRVRTSKGPYGHGCQVLRPCARWFRISQKRVRDAC